MENLKNFDKISSENIDIILEEIKEFLPYYLFNDQISTEFNVNIKSLFNLDDNDLVTLKIIHFLLSDEVKDFIECLPFLTRKLAHTTYIKKNEFKNNIHGKIDWNITIKKRLSTEFYDNNLYICSTSSKYYDLEENQFLKFILKQIISLFNKIKFVKIQKIDLNKIDSNEKWFEYVNAVVKISEKYLKKIYFDEITDINNISFKHKSKCKNNRNYLYLNVLKVYNLYDGLFINYNQKILEKLIYQRLIKATNPDKVYELYIFFKLVSILPNWKIGLLHSGNSYCVTSSLDNVDITIFYQKTPGSFKDVSNYLKILENYNIKGNVRSPDIILKFKKNNRIFYRIIEVKNVSESSYLHDGLYKALGYYKDFEKINNLKNKKFTNNFPIVLIGWAGVKINENYDIFKNDKYIILDYYSFNKNLEKLVKL